jgi:hypothetical protein
MERRSKMGDPERDGWEMYRTICYRLKQRDGSKGK